MNMMSYTVPLREIDGVTQASVVVAFDGKEDAHVSVTVSVTADAQDVLPWRTTRTEAIKDAAMLGLRLAAKAMGMMLEPVSVVVDEPGIVDQLKATEEALRSARDLAYESERVREHQRKILDGVSEALRGPPPPNVMPDHGRLPEEARAAVKRLEEMTASVEKITNTSRAWASDFERAAVAVGCSVTEGVEAVVRRAHDIRRQLQTLGSIELRLSSVERHLDDQETWHQMGRALERELIATYVESYLPDLARRLRAKEHITAESVGAVLVASAPERRAAALLSRMLEAAHHVAIRVGQSEPETALGSAVAGLRRIYDETRGALSRPAGGWTDAAALDIVSRKP